MLAILAAISMPLCSFGQSRETGEQPAVDHVIIVSVDGLRSDVLTIAPSFELPNLHRVLDHGACTLNARTDQEYTNTLPNHTGMITSRQTSGEHGHAWKRNDDVDESVTLHSSAGRYIASMFDVAHDHGLFTAMYVGKTKFGVYDVTWNEVHGAVDAVAPDHGRDKLDHYGYSSSMDVLTRAILHELAQADRRSAMLVNFAAPDSAGHGEGWDLSHGSAYRRAVARVDVQLGRLMDAIESSEALRGRVAMIITTDHGGGVPFRNHGVPYEPVNFTIPFLVWTGDGKSAGDLYELNATTRKDPRDKQPMDRPGELPPIRSLDAGNLALDLLGLPPIPGSTVNATQDLEIAAEPVAAQE
jgi:predicted AlkP superfamily pyrophosphatase or phosphodiesterase